MFSARNRTKRLRVAGNGARLRCGRGSRGRDGDSEVNEFSPDGLDGIVCVYSPVDRGWRVFVITGGSFGFTVADHAALRSALRALRVVTAANEIGTSIDVSSYRDEVARCAPAERRNDGRAVAVAGPFQNAKQCTAAAHQHAAAKVFPYGYE